MISFSFAACQSLDVYEGTYVTYSYTYDSTDIDQRFLIPSDRADTTTIKVVVQNSASDTTSNTYTRATSITELDGVIDYNILLLAEKKELLKSKSLTAEYINNKLKIFKEN